MGNVHPLPLPSSPTRPRGRARLGTAIDVFLDVADLAATTRRVYRVSLQLLREGLGADTPLAAAAAAAPGWFRGRYHAAAPATWNRELATLRSAASWWRAHGWLQAGDPDPAEGLDRRREHIDRTRALTLEQVEAIWRLDAPLREKVFWRLAYETAGRASELLNLDVPDLELVDRRARVTSKGGDVEWIYWQTGTARLLPRLLAGRRRGPVFLTDRRAVGAVAAADLDPDTGRARLSYRRAAALFEQATRPLAHPGVTDPAELAALGGWTLHQLRHSALTHDAEAGTSTPLLLARSRHASSRSLERYAHPSPEAIARHVARRDPAARQRR